MNVFLNKGRCFRLCSVCVILFAVFFALLRPFSVGALPSGRYSESEKVGFAFHKLAKFDPDYKKWVTNMDSYMAAKPTDKVTMMQMETARLQNGYFNFMPDDDLVSLTIDARLRASNYFGVSQQRGKITDVTMELIDLPQNYFPFYIGGIWIAVVIKDFDFYTHFTFSPEEYNEFAEKVGLKRGYQLIQAVKVDLQLRPISVDTTSPVMLDGLEMWLMLAEVGEAIVWRPIGRERLLIWAHNAPWFTSDIQKELLRLYEQ